MQDMDFAKAIPHIEYYAKAIDKAMQEKPDLFIAVEDSSQIIAMEFNADSSHDILG